VDGARDVKVRNLRLPLIRRKIGCGNHRAAGAITLPDLSVALKALLAPRELDELSELNSRICLRGRRGRTRCPRLVFVPRVVVARSPFAEAVYVLDPIASHVAAGNEGDGARRNPTSPRCSA
jgi:hypothetical protein